MATTLLLKEKIQTTVEKAKDLRPVVEKLITLARKDTLHARRQAFAYLLDKSVVHKLFAEVAPRFKTRPGGYTRIIKAGHRHGDAAKMAFIELVQEEMKASKAAPKKRGGTKKAKADAPAEAAQ